VRRRRLALAAAAVLAALAGLVLGARAGDDSPARAPGEPSAPREREEATRPAAPPADPARAAGRLILMRFVGTEAPEYVLRALRAGRAGGAVLFRDNVEDPAQLRRLTRALQRAARGRALLAVDQEGGPVRVIPFVGPQRSAPEQASAGTAEADSRAAGEQLAALGVNVALAPIADLPSPALGGRAFSARPAAAVAAAVRGWRAGGVAPTAKHFPGLGGATANTDDAATDLLGDRGPDLAPFRAAIEAGVPLVMAAHARYPGLDPDRIASQSPAILEDLLRRELGFRGAVITDSLEAAGALATGPVDVVAERSLRAGADLLLTTGQGSYLAIHRRLVARARRSPALHARIAQAGARVEALLPR